MTRGRDDRFSQTKDEIVVWDIVFKESDYLAFFLSFFQRKGIRMLILSLGLGRGGRKLLTRRRFQETVRVTGEDASLAVTEAQCIPDQAWLVSWSP